MQARYRKLYPRIWRHEDFVALDHLDRLVALYCLTGPQSNRIGCYVFSPGTATEDLGLPLPQFRQRFARVCRTFGWRFDEKARVLLITSWWTWNVPENANVLRGALKDAIELPSTVLYDAFADGCRNVCQTLGVTFPERSPQPSPERSPIQEQEQYQQQEQEQEQEHRPSSVADDGFDTFWAAYPRKTAIGEARKAWKKLKPSAWLQAHILEAIAQQRQCRQWLSDGGKFIPHPATWLNQSRWDDEPEPEVAQTSAKTSGNVAALAAFTRSLAR